MAGHLVHLVSPVPYSVGAASIGFLGAAWLASVVWTARDAARRCNTVALRVVSTAMALFLPIVGAAVYRLVRPFETRAEVASRRLRTSSLRAMLDDVGERCVACRTPLEPEFRCCPSCGERVRKECRGCGGLVQVNWTTCPWCAKPVVEPALPEVA
jgi:hypothetical protein